MQIFLVVSFLLLLFHCFGFLSGSVSDSSLSVDAHTQVLLALRLEREKLGMSGGEVLF